MGIILIRGFGVGVFCCYSGLFSSRKVSRGGDLGVRELQERTLSGYASNKSEDCSRNALGVGRYGISLSLSHS